MKTSKKSAASQKQDGDKFIVEKLKDILKQAIKTGNVRKQDECKRLIANFSN